jgi:hypothetical protein
VSHEMEVEDYYHQAMARVGALEEQIDNLVATIRTRDAVIEERDKTIATQREQISRMTLALDDALGLHRARLAEKEALEL